MKIDANARAIEAAGAVGLEIEAMPYEVGKAVDDAVSVFTFSIGAGSAGNLPTPERLRPARRFRYVQAGIRQALLLL